ncbi:hypothetical protein FHL15_004535 [Xylaria flabelliformis]|uniref:ATP-dependent RNA helicase n=1 Tax=Xylaria flabelliformis TaxID=2512241 RepID=A0A553I311_9PEZI|nr:hypothetical protein FHL15_004535 [Xylaria flabelliformis]
MVDAGTILAVVQLSTSVLKLGRDIAFEFFGPERTPEKLRHLNTRLQILNNSLVKILEQPGSPDKLSTANFPGSISIEKTLKECKAFLEHYRSLLLERGSLSATARRLRLIVGPDASRIDEFHRRIDQHHTELGQWRMGSIADGIDELRILITSALPGVTANHPPAYPNEAAPEFSSHPSSYKSATTPTGLSPNQESLLPTIQTSPVLRAPSRNPSLISIPELPPAAIPNSSFSSRESRSETSLVSRNIHYGSLGPASISPSSLIVPSFGHSITLILGAKDELRFSLDAYQVHEDGSARIIECFSSQTRVRHHYVRMEVTFLPRRLKHKFEITAPDGPRSILDEFSYQFTYKADRENFQRQVRIRQYLQMVRAMRIHTSEEKDIAMDIHLKVWARNESDTYPTISFAWLGRDRWKHHVEYIIRWFKNEPERRGEKRPRLIMHPYTEDTDLSYRLAGDNPSKKNSTMKDFKRRMSVGSNISFASRSTLVSHSSRVLYEGEGKIAPDHVRELGFLEIEFDNVTLREKFVNACFEAHSSAPPTSRRATLGSDTDSFGANQASVFSSRSPTVSHTTTPQHSVSELDATVCPVELPSPAIPRHIPIQFNNINPFEMPDAAVPTRHELEASELSPADTLGQGAGEKRWDETPTCGAGLNNTRMFAGALVRHTFYIVGFPDWSLDAVSAMGFARATPVQASVWPLMGAGNKDVVVEAVTGSGKTLAFLIPLVHRILRLEEPTKKHHIAAIVIAPTRELAIQIHKTLTDLVAFHPASAAVTPYLSSDEEKRPMSRFWNSLIAGITAIYRFKVDLQGILSRLPKQRRTGLFSASVGEAVSEIIRVGLRNPVKISVRVKTKSGDVIEERKTPASLQMTYLITPSQKKLPLVIQLLQNLNPRPLRRLDFPAVDFVLQIDPPTGQIFDPHVSTSTGLEHSYIGAGEQGVQAEEDFPSPEESDYISFLEVRKTPIAPFMQCDVTISDPEAEQMIIRIRDIVKKDRALYDKAQKAFVSWVRRLLRLPKMPEARHFKGDRSLGCDIDWDKYAYQNKAREKQRLEALNAAPPDPAEAEAYRAKRKRNAEAWSGKQEQEETRVARRDKKQRKREAERREKMTDEEKARDMDLAQLLAAIRKDNEKKYADSAEAKADSVNDEFKGFD